MEEDKIIISGSLIEKNKLNMNGRIYDIDYWDKFVEEFKSKIENNPNLGEISHPDLLNRDGEESENLKIINSLVTGTSLWYQDAKRRQRYRFFLNIKARIHYRYLRLKRFLGLRK